MSGELHTPFALALRKEPSVTWNSRLGDPGAVPDAVDKTSTSCLRKNQKTIRPDIVLQVQTADRVMIPAGMGVCVCGAVRGDCWL
jgi:hypothetical protein